jgi:hypothetical protein
VVQPAGPQRRAGRGGAVPWPVVRDAAEGTAAELGIPVGDLDAVAHVLDVTGSWSYLAGPGCALCSAAVAADPPAAGRLLHDVFAASRRP